MTAHVDVMDLVSRLKAAEEAFVLATVVRTVSVTAAKAGAKAVIRPDGMIAAGWIGGGELKHVEAITFGGKSLGPLDQVTRPVAIQRGATVCCSTRHASSFVD